MTQTKPFVSDSVMIGILLEFQKSLKICHIEVLEVDFDVPSTLDGIFEAFLKNSVPVKCFKRNLMVITKVMMSCNFLIFP